MPKKSGVSDTPEKPLEIISYKGMDANMQCRGFQFEIGKTYEVTGSIKTCKNGFHACEHPLDVFRHYVPAGNRFFKVIQSGDTNREGGQDAKIASAKISISVELSLHEMIASAVEWVFDRAKPEGEVAKGKNGLATASGYSGAATASGDRGAATATGHYGRVRGAVGNALFLLYRDPDTSEILHVWSGIVGRNDIKPNTWYQLGADGLPVEIK